MLKLMLDNIYKIKARILTGNNKKNSTVQLYWNPLHKIRTKMRTIMNNSLSWTNLSIRKYRLPIKRMKQYQDLLQHILDEGTLKEDRTGTGTKSVFGHQMRFDLRHGKFPLFTTRMEIDDSVVF